VPAVYWDYCATEVMVMERMHGTPVSQVAALRAQGVVLLETPDIYYELVDKRVQNHGEPLDELKKRAILVDGGPKGGLLLQIFTKTVIGPIFFEIIQRKGDEGFGEGNFKALFESMELDQIRRGVLRGQTPVDKSG